MTKSIIPAYRVLFICMGNICRSPTAEGVFRHQVIKAGLANQVLIDSAGTHNYHPGEAPDMRSQQHAAKRGYDLSKIRARQLTDEDFVDFDLLLVMDWDNLALAEAQCPPQHQAKLRRLTEFCTQLEATVVPDPYYDGEAGFEYVLDLIEDASEGLLNHVQKKIA